MRLSGNIMAEQYKGTAIRVTEPLNYFAEPWKLDWYAKNGKAYCNKIGRAAMKIGSRVDELIKGQVSNQLLTLDKKKDTIEVINCLKAWGKWQEVYQPKSIVPGTRLFATIEGVEVTGEPDIFVDDVLVDIKCSAKISLAYWIQVNMYKFLSSEQSMYGSKVVEGNVGILRLDKLTTSYEYVVKDYDARLVDVWIGMMRAMVYYKGEENGDVI